MRNQDWGHEVASCQQATEGLLKEAQQAGARQAEVHCYQSIGLTTSVREQMVENFAYNQSKLLVVTVYFGYQKGQASTTDFEADALRSTLNAACRIAKLTQPDEAAGLAEPQYLASTYPDLNLYHPWSITPKRAIEKAKACESYALALDSNIASEGVAIGSFDSLNLYANTHGFLGYYLHSEHRMSCSLVARDKAGNLQRDWEETSSREPSDLQSVEILAKAAVGNTVRRLEARCIKTCEVPVIFESRVAISLLDCFLQAISGRALYQKASFLLDHCGELVFPKHVSIQEQPYLLKGLGSAPFDREGVAAKRRYLVKNGILQGYLLGSYAARRLGLVATGNADRYYNVELSTDEPDLPALLNKMGTGLLVTELIGDGTNLVTGDYSQGAAGFWVKNGQIQYPVKEITIAGNLRDMYRHLVAIAGDCNQESKIKTGSILVERMMVAGE